jgi:Methyltransferase domain
LGVAGRKLTASKPADNGEEGLYAAPHDVQGVEDCFYYHVMDLPGHGTVGGGWDLREGVNEYLGNIEVSGKRVLEIGPASGFLTAHLESHGAEVVGVELSEEEEWEVATSHRLTSKRIEAIHARRDRHRQLLRNSFWFTYKVFGLSARLHYGNAYSLPSELGRFDISLLASVLLHARDPLRIIQQCAGLTGEAIVIVERHHPELEGSIARLVPSAEMDVSDIWWDFSQGYFVQFLGLLGFTRVETNLHPQPYRPKPEVPITVPIDMFTIVAYRG